MEVCSQRIPKCSVLMNSFDAPKLPRPLKPFSFVRINAVFRQCNCFINVFCVEHFNFWTMNIEVGVNNRLASEGFSDTSFKRFEELLRDAFCSRSKDAKTGMTVLI